MFDTGPTRLADSCPGCGEWQEPVVVLAAEHSRGVDCLYTCGCHNMLWSAIVAYPVNEGAN